MTILESLNFISELIEMIRDREINSDNMDGIIERLEEIKERIKN